MKKNLSRNQGISHYSMDTPSMSSPPHLLDKLTSDVTVVTAYVNIGRFQKGEGSKQSSPEQYHKWMAVFAKIDNPLIAFLEDDSDVELFLRLRSKIPQNKTKIIQFSRKDTWAFSLRQKISDIYLQPGYPKHHPNTVIPEYSCAMHAKYEFMSKAATENPFRTKYFSWLDIGLFRDISSKAQAEMFHLVLPPQFQESKVAYTQVYPRNPKQKPEIIFKSNKVWVCGCYFVATATIMKSWTDIYMKSVEYYLSQHLMNTDQQVLCSMFNENRSSIDVQLYKSDGRFNAWFHLGYLSKNTTKNTSKEV